jgi:prevent-host-death family protein
MGKMMGAAEFKTHVLRLLKEVERDGQTVTVTNRGQPVAKLVPIDAAPAGAAPFVGCMKGSVTIHGDIVGPAWEDPWSAELDSDLDVGAEGR